MMSYDDESESTPISAQADLASDEMAIPKYGTVAELLNMTPKIPPAFNGQFSWFQYEERLDEWCDITTLTPRRRGPMLKSRLCGLAEKYKTFLDRTALCDPDTGVTYFKDQLRQHFIKGTDHTYLWRFLSFMQKSYRRPSTELIEWIVRFETALRKLIEAWMDVMPLKRPDDPAYLADVADLNQALIQMAAQAAQAAAQQPMQMAMAPPQPVLFDPNDPTVFEDWRQREIRAYNVVHGKR